MELKIGDIVRFEGEDYANTLYASKHDLFKIMEVVFDTKYYSGVGVFIKAIDCPFCGHHNLHEASGWFDSGWFTPVQ